jgi:FMN phosphatase YigB (HAD superfamily)
VVFDIGGVLEITPRSPSCGRPDPRIDALICARLDLHAHETVFLGDKDLCVDGARDGGIHAVRYQDNTQAIDEIEKLLTGP